jgi:glycosyltransferase involved in cell wall biosynthesis
MNKHLLVISYRFPPETYPLTSRVKNMLEHLEASWDITAITAAKDAKVGQNVRIVRVPPRTPERLLRTLKRFRLGKFVDWLVWPDPYVFWVPAALSEARRLIRERRPDALLVFMMPYSTGLAGLRLKRETGIPLMLNLNDSITCSDMNPSHPSWLHYRLAHRLEDRYVRQADALVYVSGRNVERVAARQPEAHRRKLHLIRRGAKPMDPADPSSHIDGIFRIVYTGGMGGWYPFLDDRAKPSLGKRLFHAWTRFGRYRLVKLDHRSHSPVYIGQAMRDVMERHPEWAGRIEMNVFGNQYPESVVQNVLRMHGIADFVRVYPPVPHAEVRDKVRQADLLFMALPERTDGSPGGRISAKTYEYLMTDRPILAAVPNGENREFLVGKPGVYLVEPRDCAAMADVVERLAADVFGGHPQRIDRTELQAGLTNRSRALAFAEVLESVVRP